MKTATLRGLILLTWCLGVLSSNCSGDPYITFSCPARGGFYCEGSGSLASDIIIRCLDGCPVFGNCNDDLACYPPGSGVHQGALCYQDSPTAGNAQCTDNCVNVTRVDGTVTYPMGCISSVLSIYTPGIAECSSLGTNASTLPVPSGFIHSTGSSDSATTTNTFGTTSFTAAGTSSASASTAPNTQTPTPTAQSNAGTQRAAAPSMDTGIGLFAMMAFLLGI